VAGHIYCEKKRARFHILPSSNLREKHLNYQVYTSLRLLGGENTLDKELTRSKRGGADCVQEKGDLKIFNQIRI
jgi:hypothetical protein